MVLEFPLCGIAWKKITLLLPFTKTHCLPLIFLNIPSARHDLRGFCRLPPFPDFLNLRRGPVVARTTVQEYCKRLQNLSHSTICRKSMELVFSANMSWLFIGFKKQELTRQREKLDERGAAALHDALETKWVSNES